MGAFREKSFKRLETSDDPTNTPPNIHVECVAHLMRCEQTTRLTQAQPGVLGFRFSLRSFMVILVQALTGEEIVC
eukprot:4507926-Amphidinium_carterae.1